MGGGAPRSPVPFPLPPPQPFFFPAEETQPPGPGTPRGSPSPSPSPSPRPRSGPEERAEVEGPGHPPTPASPWRETSLDGPYEKAKKAGDDPGDSETWGARCCPTSPPPVATAPGSPDLAASLVPRTADVPPYRFVPIRTLVLCRQVGSSAPSTPEPPSRRGQSQSLRYGPCAERGRGFLGGGWRGITPWDGGYNPMGRKERNPGEGRRR